MSTPERWVRFETAEGRRHGYVAGDSIVPIAGDLFGEWRQSGDTVPLVGARLLASVIPPTFYACGINYEGHWRTAAAEFGLDLDKTWPRSPEIGYRAQGAIVGPGDAIVLPRDVPPNVQVESELAVVIGKRAKHVRAAEAAEYIFGYTILQRCLGAGLAIPGPHILALEEQRHLQAARPVAPARRGSREARHARAHQWRDTRDLSHGPDDLLHRGLHRSHDPLHHAGSGDVIIMGTDGHCPAIQAGDTVSIEIEGIGTLTNPVIGSDGP